MTDNESDKENNTFDKLFKVNDVSSVGNSWRTATTIFSKEETFENEKENFMSDELIYKAMTKLNMTSELFVTGGFRGSKRNTERYYFHS